MELQKIYTEAFVAQLKKNASPSKYQSEEQFEVENPEYTQLGGVYNNAVNIAPMENSGNDENGWKMKLFYIDDATAEFRNMFSVDESYNFKY